MSTLLFAPVSRRKLAASLLVVSCALLPFSLRAEDKKKNPASKMYVADVNGDAQIDTGDSIEDMVKKSVYNAQGTVIETKKPDSADDKNKHFSTMVYSNGTGAYFDNDTRVEVRKFMQEPFTPNRTDSETEPSISQTQAFVARGTVGLCTSKLVAGSTMNYQTPHGSVAIRGRKVVVEAGDNFTKISMLEGDSTVRGGSTDMGGQTLHSGQQAIIRQGDHGQNIVQISNIPSNEMPALDDKVSMACMAKKTVYFEVKEKKTTDSGYNPLASSGSGDANGGSSGPVSAFDGDNSTSATTTTTTEIVAVPTTNNNLPVTYTVSPDQITSSSNTPGGE